MSRSKTRLAEETFARRASAYDAETGWVTEHALLEPLVPAKNAFPESYCGRFLDVCAGTGRVASLAATKGWNVVAVDQSREMLSALGGGPILSIQSDANNLPFVGKSFDICAMRQALHYFDPSQIIEQMLHLSWSEVRLGHITTHHEDDVGLWEEYFEVASPGRKHVFVPGMISNIVDSLGVQVSKETVLFSTERFSGPVEHLGSKVVDELRENFLRGDRSVVERYVQDIDSDQELIMRLRWEFHTIKVP